MTAREMVIRRTALEPDVASAYVRMAEERVRFYLHYAEDKNIDMFATVTAEIAILLYDEDKARKAADIATQNVEGSELESESFSEGGVSVTKRFRSGSEVANEYEKLVAKKLAELSDFIITTDDMHKVRFL